MDWEYRKKLILSEIKSLDSDVISFQEFERDEDFISKLSSAGYEVYKI